MTRPKRFELPIFSALAFVLLLLAAVSLAIGTGDSVREVVSALLAGPDQSGLGRSLWLVRLPRVLMAGACGWMLATAGVGFQGILRNPLADPYVTGIAGGAAVGASVALAFGFSGLLWGFGTTALAFLCAFGGALLVFAIARGGGGTNVGTFLLAGLAIGSMLWAVITLLLLVAQSSFERVVFWLMGSFTLADWSHLSVCLLVGTVGVIGLSGTGRSLNVYALGEESASSLGVDVERLKRRVLLFGSLATAAAVSVAGIIGFVGLIVPHLGRRLVSPNHTALYPASGLLGAALLIAADTLARTVLPMREIPVGVLTALLGAPFFIRMLRAKL